jgi:SAM-dependent methyltransferase
MTDSVGSEEWNRRYAGSELLWTARPNRFLVAETADLTPGRALDLACGEGRNAVWLAKQGWQVTGVDFSAAALDKAAGLARGNEVDVEWAEADLLDYRPEPRAYDLVVVAYLQLPAAERRRVLRAAANAVAVGRTLLVVAHDRSNLEHGHGGPQHPDVLYTAADVAADLKGTGLEIERADTVERPVETTDGERIALDLLVRARRRPSRQPEGMMQGA